MERFPGYNSLTPQNLRDQISQAERSKHLLQSPLETVYAYDVNSLHQIPQIPFESTNTNEGENDSARTDEIINDFDEPLNEVECKACNKARDLLTLINNEQGDMSERKWSTRNKQIPTNNDIQSINRIIKLLSNEHQSMQSMTPLNKLWFLNCVMYASIIAWNLINNVKCEIKQYKHNNKKPLEYKWLVEIEREIKDKRKLLSKCVAEIDRLKKNGRMTKRTKKNRDEISKYCGNISVHSVTQLVCKLKAEVRRKSHSRKRKLKNQKSRELNKAFKNNQCNVFSKFKNIIENDSENELPKYVELEKERKFFNNADDVIKFWKSLWCQPDIGNPNAEWLNEYTEHFEKVIPQIEADDIILETVNIRKIIQKKRNWSSPGPDLIVNFWLKKLTVTHDLFKNIFMDIINNSRTMVEWFCRGRTSLLEKSGAWAFDNTRPITCTNNLYKWFTSVLQVKINEHKKKFGFMQMDQRGAKEKCSGTVENLIIDDMVLKDAHDNKRNLSCCWVDVRKAYDSLSHSWMKKMLQIHRFPIKLQRIIGEIMNKWNTVLVVPLENGDVISGPISITNGVFQGDVPSGDMFTLSLNPVSWELRRYPGYTLSKPLCEKITHLFFIDDLKNYNGKLKDMINILSDIKEKMEDAGLKWNAAKCNVMTLKRGKIDPAYESIQLNDGTVVKTIKNTETYKFLGVPENEMHDVDNIVDKLKKKVKQRTSVIWTSPLSDYNKVMATNVFVHSAMEYFMWSEKFNLGDIREIDLSIRKIMNDVKAKYALQSNTILYIPRNKGGRGLKCLETIYKKTKVVAAMNLLTRDDPRMECVRKFEKKRIQKGRSTCITDAIRFAKEDFDLTFEALENSFIVHYEKNGETLTTSNKKVVKDLMKQNITGTLLEKIESSSWQGKIHNIRKNDENIKINECYAWLTKWKDAPVEVINDFHSINLQTVPTLSFKKFRTGENITSTVCRLCSLGVESIKHLLSNCGKFVAHAYKRRHDRVLQFILFSYLRKINLIDSCPPWYTKVCIKPMYQNKDIEVYWDIPEYSGYASEDAEHRPLRPDGKIIDNLNKTIFILEMSIPWIENRTTKLEEKNEKYLNIIQNLKLQHPGYTVKQLTFIIDCMGGYSKDLITNLKGLGFTKTEIHSMLPKIQKIVIIEANSVINHFKILTS